VPRDGPVGQHDKISTRTAQAPHEQTEATRTYVQTSLARRANRATRRESTAEQNRADNTERITRCQNTKAHSSIRLLRANGVSQSADEAVGRPAQGEETERHKPGLGAEGAQRAAKP